VLSSDPDARVLPSGENVTDVTSFVCSLRVARNVIFFAEFFSLARAANFLHCANKLYFFPVHVCLGHAINHFLCREIDNVK